MLRIVCALWLLLSLPSKLSAISNTDFLELTEQIFFKIKEEYFQEANNQELFKAAADGILSSLDRYSAYLTPRDYEEIKIRTKGEFIGIGVAITKIGSSIIIARVNPGSSADGAGIKAQDIILTVDDQPINNTIEAAEAVRGRPGTLVKLQVKRGNKNLLFTVNRAKIRVNSLHSNIIENNIIYIKIDNFLETTAADLRSQLAQMKIHPKWTQIRGLILDLRDNPGGLLNQAVEIVDCFLDQGVIVQIKGRGNKNRIYAASRGDLLSSLPIAVLINKGSASAAEIVAGALQENNRATIIGEKSFGKGLVQTIIPLDLRIGGKRINNGAIRITTAAYYTPKGNSINEKGVVPDIPAQHGLDPLQTAINTLG